MIIDRGSREPEVRQELHEICSIVKHRAGYDYTDYCFLEVLPPFIGEGVNKCIANGIGLITVMPYFLYPGMKLKDTVKQSAKICKDLEVKVAIARPLSYHPMMAQLIMDRLRQLKNDRGIDFADRECDIVLIGHGSSDRNAREAFMFTADSLKKYYRNVHSCFLELDRPSIQEGIEKAVFSNPKVLLIMPYFLHKGAHVKVDVIKEVEAGLYKYGFKSAFIAKHLGVDEKLVDLVVERAKEVEKRFGI